MAAVTLVKHYKITQQEYPDNNSKSHRSITTSVKIEGDVILLRAERLL